MFKIQMFQTDKSLRFWDSDLGFVSDFDIRILNLRGTIDAQIYFL